MKRKWLTVGIILLFVAIAYAPALAQNTEKSQSSRGTWLYVGGSGPGNYTRIQDAINNSTGGDTVYVYNDSSPYYEHVLVNKSINLIGEETNTTIIDGSNDEDVVVFSADCIYIEGFTIRNSGEWGGSNTQNSGIEIVDCNNCYIIYCSFTDDSVGVHLQNSSHDIISNCYFITDDIGIYLYDHYNLVSSQSYNLIIYNIIQYNGNAITLSNRESSYNTIMGNNISFNGHGIYLVHSQYNVMRYNNLFDNENYGVEIKNYEGEYEYNTIHHNNFILNNGGDTQGCDNYDGWNYWYNPSQNQGNYWSDYNGTDNNGDGIGDTPYTIDGMSNLQDLYPLIRTTPLPNQTNHVPTSPKIIGMTDGKAGKQYQYTFSSWDPDGDEVFLNVDWGDGTGTGYIGPYTSNEEIELQHKWYHSDKYMISAIAQDTCNGYSEWSSLQVIMSDKAPTPPFIEGTTNGKVKVNYTYNFTSTNTEDDLISYYINWGDGTNSGWFGAYESNQKVQASHQWDKKGNYQIKAKAKDAYGESEWSIFSITMPFSYEPQFLFIHWLLERFPNTFPLLRFILNC